MIRHILPICLMFLSLITFADNNGICLIRIEPVGSGSGFFVADNRVITCWHVVRDNIEDGTSIRAEYNGKIIPLRVIDYNEYDDLALLECITEDEKIFNIAESSPVIGDKLTNKGHPSGKWKCYSSPGTVIELVTFIYKNGDKSPRYICNSCVQNGMSGGPVLNENGEVVGAVSARNSESTQSIICTLEKIKEILSKNP